MPDTMITTADESKVATKPKPLKALLREYRKTYQAWGVALKALAPQEDSMSEEAWNAATTAAGDLNAAAREAMIEAPVVTLSDIALKLRFLFEVDDEDIDSSEPAPNDWDARIVKNILRDIDKPSEPGLSLRELRKQCKAAFRASLAADDAADKKRFAVREEYHPPIPKGLEVEVTCEGQSRRRVMRLEDIEHFVSTGEVSREEVPALTKALQEWEAACTAIDVEHGVAALDEVAAQAEDLYDRLDNQFIDTPARSLDDICVKLEFLAMLEDMKETPDMHPARLVFGLIRDLKQMIGATR